MDPATAIIGSAIIGGGLGAIGNYISGTQNINAARELADKSFDASKEAYSTRYQTTMNDMRAAGLNPILAATGGFNVSGAPQMQIPSSQYYGSYASSAKDMISGFKDVKQTELMESEKGKIEVEIEQISQNVIKTVQEVAESRTRQNLMTQQEKESVQKVMESVQRVNNMVQEVTNMKKQVDKMKAEIPMYVSQAKMYGEQAKTQSSIRDEIQAKIGLIFQETQVIKEQMPKLQRESEIYDGPGGAVLTFLERVIGLVLPWAVAGKAAGVIGRKKYPTIITE